MLTRSTNQHTHQYAFSLGLTMLSASASCVQLSDIRRWRLSRVNLLATAIGSTRAASLRRRILNDEQRTVRLERLVTARGMMGGKGQEP